MDVARDEMASYNSIKTERKHRLPVDLNVSVISEASWPSYPNVPVQVPPVVMTAINDFENFYCTKHSGRKLQWKHQLAHCQLRARFPKGNKELIVSSFQAIVLLLFNEVPDGESLNYGQIQEATKLSKRPKSKSHSWQANTTCSGRRIAANAAVARMCAVPGAQQEAEGPRGRDDRRVHVQRGILGRQDADQDQPDPAEGDQGRKREDARAGGEGPAVRDQGGDSAHHEESPENHARRAGSRGDQGDPKSGSFGAGGDQDEHRAVSGSMVRGERG